MKRLETFFWYYRTKKETKLQLAAFFACPAKWQRKAHWNTPARPACILPVAQPSQITPNTKGAPRNTTLTRLKGVVHRGLHHNMPNLEKFAGKTHSMVPRDNMEEQCIDIKLEKQALLKRHPSKYQPVKDFVVAPCKQHQKFFPTLAQD